MKTKSIENIAAAKLLMKKEMYAPSVHCSYYACYQLMMYVLNFKLNHSYIKQKTLCGTSHINTIKMCFNLLSAKNLNRVASTISVQMDTLRKERLKADYNPMNINKTTATEASLRMTIVIDELNGIQ